MFQRETSALRISTESLADSLLAQCQIDPEAPAYTEATFQYKLRRARAREPVIALHLAALAPERLDRCEIRALIARARLTPTQYECLTLRLDGFTFVDIGTLCGTSKQSAQSTYVVALKKLRDAWSQYRYAGLARVYWRELRRGRR